MRSFIQLFDRCVMCLVAQVHVHVLESFGLTRIDSCACGWCDDGRYERLVDGAKYVSEGDSVVEGWVNGF